MESLSARATLTKAQFFLNQAVANEAAAHGSSERTAFLANIEAAIVYGRSTTFHLQKQFAAVAGFETWSQGAQQRLRSDERFRYLLETRNIILHQGPAPIGRTIEVTLSTAVEIDCAWSVVVKRGSPWSLRRPRILLEDARRAYCNRSEIGLNGESGKGRERRRLEEQSTITQRFCFDDPRFKATPAQLILIDYLHALDLNVSDAEHRFQRAPA